MKHTPGPWEVTRYVSKESKVVSTGPVYWIQPKGRMILPAVSCSSGYTQEEAKANAHLIAASPLLLDACLNIYENMADRGELIEEDTGEEYNEVRIIREAIDKALPGQGYDKP